MEKYEGEEGEKGAEIKERNKITVFLYNATGKDLVVTT